MSVLVFVIGILVSCNGHQKQVEDLKGEVLGIHDEVMPLMGKIKEEEKRLMTASGKLMTEDSAANKATSDKMRATAKKLENAYEGMFVWMRQYKLDFEGMSQEQVIAYLEDQKEKVTKVNEEITKALEEAKAY
ncbi:hypothetical protein Echvi_0008 [Echinicola vietnamensis DSM 17526]|uniref:Viral A-type inclusion protein n=2 Tax=Echinicola TaxID=390846 RepID=L0FSN8_ECHVK|nr:hypothetical protein Echvi_0008 [Echinicola vietnamensis DSM 17526]